MGEKLAKTSMIRDSEEYRQRMLALSKEQDDAGEEAESWYIKHTNGGVPYWEKGIRTPAGGAARHPFVDFRNPEERTKFLEQRKFARELATSSFQAGYAKAAIDYADLIIAFEKQHLMEALGPDASDADKALGWRIVKDMKDRLGGKPTQMLDVSATNTTNVNVVLQIAAAAESEPVELDAFEVQVVPDPEPDEPQDVDEL